MSTNKLLRKQVFDKTKGRCWYCGVKLTVDLLAGTFNHSIHPTNFVIDHVIPKNYGGNGKIENLVPSCSWCNRQKHDMNIEEFRDHITRLSNNIPKFTEQQILYLKSNNINLPTVERYIFYFEKYGLEQS